MPSAAAQLEAVLKFADQLQLRANQQIGLLHLVIQKKLIAMLYNCIRILQGGHFCDSF
jgi:hypothetical protein